MNIVYCKNVKVKVFNCDPPNDPTPYPWVVMILQGDDNKSNVIVGWCKTRETARNYAKAVRNSLNFSNIEG